LKIINYQSKIFFDYVFYSICGGAGIRNTSLFFLCRAWFFVGWVGKKADFRVNNTLGE
jgi:hypothetical protein